jgi:cell division protein FtsZ
MFEISDESQEGARIMVAGIGGAGGNALQDMINISDVELISANTDAQALKKASAEINTLQLGDEITRGLGAGADPEVGRKAALEDRERIAEIVQNSDMLFITAGMGGGTGTGAAPIFAEVANELGILTVAVVTKPFSFEGKKRKNVAEAGINALAQSVDSLITIPNDKLLSVLGKNVSLMEAFKAANQVLLDAVQGISDLITKPGLINVDFADVKNVMSVKGTAMMGNGRASGENRAQRAAEAAISSPLLEDVDLSDAQGMLVNITAGYDMSIGEFETVGDTVRNLASDDATVVVGTVLDPDIQDELSVTVVATGLCSSKAGNRPTVEQRLNENVKHDGTIDYQSLDQPTLLRQTNKTNADEEQEKEDYQYLDIPAFLRKQEKAQQEEECSE